MDSATGNVTIGGAVYRVSWYALAFNERDLWEVRDSSGFKVRTTSLKKLAIAEFKSVVYQAAMKWLNVES